MSMSLTSFAPYQPLQGPRHLWLPGHSMGAAGAAQAGFLVLQHLCQASQ